MQKKILKITPTSGLADERLEDTAIVHVPTVLQNTLIDHQLHCIH